MKYIEINLDDPFERTLAAILSLPEGGDARGANDETVAQALRCLYTAAHGRAVQTSLGSISIAPATDSSLKDAPLRLDTRSDLLALAQRKGGFTRRATANFHETRGGVGSAFSEFIAGRLGAPEYWPSSSPVIRHAVPGPMTVTDDHLKRMITKNVPIHITPHGLRLNPSLRCFVETKVSALSRFASDMLAAEIVLRGKRGATQLFSVSARVALPGRDLRASATHANPYGAIHQLVARLARLARKRKTRFSRAFRRPSKKQVKPWLGWSTLLFSP
jgi:ribosomal subunit interface protein